VDQRVAPREYIAHREVFAKHRPSRLGAVRGHVEQRAAAGQVCIPEVGGVRTTVPFARSECREATDRPRLDHLAHPDHLGVEDDVLEIGAEDPRFRDESEHLGRFRGVPS